jgi:Tfp pilus assembly protein PilX
MNKQDGMSLVITLVLLSIITMASLSAMQNSGIENRMTANYRHSAEVFHETNNELVAQIRELNTTQNIINLLDKAENKQSLIRLSHSTLPVDITVTANLEGNCTSCLRGYDLALFDGEALEITASGSATPISSTQYMGISVVVPKP